MYHGCRALTFALARLSCLRCCTRFLSNTGEGKNRTAEGREIEQEKEGTDWKGQGMRGSEGKEKGDREYLRHVRF